MTFLADHVWQSTLVAAGAAVAAAMCARQPARVRYAIWLVASLKFLVPFAWLTMFGGYVPWPADRTAAPPAAVSTAWAIGRPFSPDAAAFDRDPALPAGTRASDVVSGLVVTAWMCGSLVLIGRRWAGVRRARAAARSARPLETGREAAALNRVAGSRRAQVTLRLSLLRTSPCVLGILRPVVLWPAGLSDRLTDAQLDAVMAHELSHAHRRHNLAAAAHGLVEIVFWFHPLVWWIGARLIDERERACDEDVLQSGTGPDLYADGILRVCEFSVCAPCLGSARINDSTLVHRIEAIMSHQAPKPLGWRRALLVAAGTALIVGPITLGAVSGSRSAVQAATGSITGVVTDQSGAVIAGITVTARPTDGGGTARAAATDTSGRYVFTDVPAGEYELRIERPGFKIVRALTTVRGGAEAVVHAEMRLGSLAETVTLRASSQPSQPSPPTSEPELLEQIGRNQDAPRAYLELAELYYRQERYGESEAMLARAVELIRAQAAAARASVVPALPGGGEIKEPRKIRDVKPVYPAAARAAQVSGRVEIEATIGDDGTVKDARVLRGVPLLDEAALGAVRQWVFTPTLLNGVPVEVVMYASVTFEVSK